MPASSKIAIISVASTAAVALTTAFVQPGAPRGAAQRQAKSDSTVHIASAPVDEVGSSSVFGVASVGVALAAVCGRMQRQPKVGRQVALRAAAVEAPRPFDPSKQLGAMEPLGFFDPLGFSKVGDESGFRNLRAAELKHGRVAMMAALGGVIQHYVKIPGFEKVPAGLGAVTSAPGTYGFIALFLIAGAMELAVWTQDDKKEPGNFGDPLGLGQYDADMRNRELNNGRFAMFAALGIVAADLATGKDAMQQFGM